MVRTGRSQELCHLPDHRERSHPDRRAPHPNSPGPPGVALQSLNAIRSLAGHKFWHDDASIADAECIAPELLSSHSRITGSNLLALALANAGRLATMDQKLATEVVPDGRKALELIHAR